MTTRRDARRDYRHFPPEYSELLFRFDASGSAAIGPMSLRDAKHAVRDLYRFKMFLTSGADTDPDDEHCRDLLNIFATCILSVEPASVASGPDNALTHIVVLRRNPVVAAVRATTTI